MAIEFRCPNCQQLLRVPDDSVGKNARCPQCQSLVQVPASSTGSAAGPPAAAPPEWPQQPLGPRPAPPPKPLYEAEAADPLPNPHAPSAPAFQPMPQSPFAPGGGIQPQRIGLELIWNHAWQVWQANLGLVVGVTFVVVLISAPIDLGSEAIEGLLREEGEEAAAAIVGLLGSVLSFMVDVFLGIGQTQIMLKLARGQRAEFGELFSGGPLYLPVLAATFLATLCFGLGLALCIVPGVILGLMFWPYFWLMVDRKAGITDSFSLASKITESNWGTAFILALLSFGLYLLGCTALCVGVLFTAPLVSLLWTTAYLMMSGQLSPYPMHIPPPGQPVAGKW